MTKDPFAPQLPALSTDEEIGYRRGFDQGVASVFQALFPDDPEPECVELYQKQCKLFRLGRVKHAPWMRMADGEAIRTWIAKEHVAQ